MTCEDDKEKKEMKKIKPKAAIVDFDNTLVLTEKFILEHIRRTCVSIGIAIPSDESIRAIIKANPPFEKIFDTLFAEKGVDVLVEYRKTAKNFHFEPSEGGKEFIKNAFESGVKIIIVTNRLNLLEERLVQAGYDLTWFEAKLTPPLGIKKPDKNSYNEAFERLYLLGINPEQCVVMGDHPDDFIACPNGVPFVGVLTGLSSAEDFVAEGADADYLIPNLLETNKVLEI